MASADSPQTDCSAALSRLSRVSPNMNMLLCFAPAPRALTPPGQTCKQVWLTGLTAVSRLLPAPSAFTLWTLDDIWDFGTQGNLVRPSGLLCRFCSYSRDFPSDILSHGSLPPRSCLSTASRRFALRAATAWQANPPYSRRGLCSSGLGLRIITALCGLSPQFAYRVGRTTERSRREISCGSGWIHGEGFEPPTNSVSTSRTTAELSVRGERRGAVAGQCAGGRDGFVVPC